VEEEGSSLCSFLIRIIEEFFLYPTQVLRIIFQQINKLHVRINEDHLISRENSKN